MRESITAKEPAGETEARKIMEELKDAIKSGRLVPGTRLQPEKKLAESFSSTVHVIRKVLRQLRKEQVIYSKPKFGVFVSGDLLLSEKDDPKTLDMPLYNDHTNVLRFLSSSILPEHQALQSFAVEEFQKLDPVCKVDISGMSEKTKIPVRESDFDIFETSNPLCYHRHRSSFLDIKKYFPGKVQCVDRDSAAIPGFYATAVLLTNPRLLKELGCAEPTYRNFDEQMSYFEEVTERCAKKKMRLPGTMLSSIFLLGKILTSIFIDFTNRNITQKEFLERYHDKIDHYTAYWRRYRISFPQQANANTNAFGDKKTPLLFAYSTEILSFRHFYPAMDFRMRPLLTFQGKLSRLTIPLSISKTTEHPVECIHFLNQYQGPAVQRKAAELGYVPLSENLYDSLPFAADFPAMEGDDPIFFATDVEYYIGINILNAELWNIILFDKAVDEALSDALYFARAYLNFKLDAKTRKLQDERGKIFI